MSYASRSGFVWRCGLLLAGSLPLATSAWASGAAAGSDSALSMAPRVDPIFTDWRLEDGAAASDLFLAAPATGNTDSSLASVGSLSLAAQDLKVPPDPRYRTFGGRVGAVKWETIGIAALLTATNIEKVIDDPQSFRFQDEGLFGKDTGTLGVDKLAHAYNTYLISEILYMRMERKTGGGTPSAVTAAVLGSGLQIYAELFDAFHAGSGFSVGDVAFNMGGAAFSVLRNSVPGVKSKLDFRIMIVPNDDFYTPRGKKHFEQQHFLFALKLSGFEKLRNSPLRFLELHAGYRAKDFTIPDRLAGITPQRLPFLGVGFNFSELFFNKRKGWLSKAARTGLQYYQIPYTAVHVDLPTGRLSP